MYSSDAAELFLLTEALEDFVHLETGNPVSHQWLAWNLLRIRWGAVKAAVGVGHARPLPGQA
jgi:hypothetical protein